MCMMVTAQISILTFSHLTKIFLILIFIFLFVNAMVLALHIVTILGFHLEVLGLKSNACVYVVFILFMHVKDQFWLQL